MGWIIQLLSLGREEIFHTPFRLALVAHPTSSTMGTAAVSRGGKRLQHGIYFPPPSSTEVKEVVVLYLYSPSGPS